METTEQETIEETAPPLTKEQAEALGAMGRRYVEGESFASIFGVNEKYLEMAEERAYQLYQAGRYEDARAVCMGIISLDSDRYYPYLVIGDVELKQLGLQQAREYLHLAHERAPEAIPVLAKYGEVLMRSREFSAGRPHLEKVVERVEDPDNPHRRRAQALLRLCADAE